MLLVPAPGHLCAPAYMQLAGQSLCCFHGQTNGGIAVHILAGVIIFGSIAATMYLELAAILPNVVEILANSAGAI